MTSHTYSTSSPMSGLNPLPLAWRLQHRTGALLATPYRYALDAVLFAERHLPEIAGDLVPVPEPLGLTIERAAYDLLTFESHKRGYNCPGCDEWIHDQEAHRHAESCVPLMAEALASLGLAQGGPDA